MIFYFFAFIFNYVINNYTQYEDSLSWAISLTALALTSFSIKLGRESDERMTTIAGDTFLAIAGTLEDRRLDLKNKRLQYERMLDTHYQNTLVFKLAKIDYENILSFSIWKCLTDIRRIEDFKKYMGGGKHLSDKQSKIIKYLKLYFDELIIGRNILQMQISSEYKEQILSMFSIVAEMQLYQTHMFNNMIYESILDLTQ